MYDTVKIAQTIKETAKSKNIVLKNMLEECGMNKNAISTMISRGSVPQADNLAKIADYLEVSVDYLLGRTDQPNGFINNENGFKSINVNGSVGNNSINNNYAELDKHDRELLEEYNKLSLKNKAKVINLIAELEENNG